MAVLKDVAARAGVSPSAVSKYLHTPDEMRESTKAKIRRAIDELGYVPSPVAQNLRLGRTGVIAVALPEGKNPFFWEIFSRLHGRSLAEGLLPVFLQTGTPAERAAFGRFLSSRRADGAILFDERAGAGDIAAEGVPLAVIRPLETAAGPGVIGLDLASGMREVCRHLLAKGCRRFAYLAEPGDNDCASQKRAAAADELRAAGVTLAPADVFRCREISFLGGFEAAARLLASGGAPEAILAESDALALGCIKCLAQQGLRVPEDVRVSGFDNTSLATLAATELTTVDAPLDALCCAAFRMLADQLAGRAPRPGKVFRTALVARASTGGE